MTNPINETAWSEATLFASGKGHAYNDLAAYIGGLDNDNGNDNDNQVVLQPWNVVYDTSASASAGSSSSCIYNNLVCKSIPEGDILVNSKSSFSIVKAVMQVSQIKSNQV